MLTKTEVKIILILLDDQGHAEWELTRLLEDENQKMPSNINPILKTMKAMGIIIKGESRPSRKQLEGEPRFIRKEPDGEPTLIRKKPKKEGNYKEFPYHLSKRIEDFRLLIREIIKAGRPYDTGFLVAIINKSKYMKNMRKEFNDEDIYGIINEELQNSESPLSDPFFVKIIAPELEEPIVACEAPPGTEIQIWYDGYLRRKSSKIFYE